MCVGKGSCECAWVCVCLKLVAFCPFHGLQFLGKELSLPLLRWFVSNDVHQIFLFSSEKNEWIVEETEILNRIAV